MLIWIDLETGTWGPADQLVLVEIEDEDDVAGLADLSDTERKVYGQEHGHGAVPAL